MLGDCIRRDGSTREPLEATTSPQGDGCSPLSRRLSCRPRSLDQTAAALLERTDHGETSTLKVGEPRGRCQLDGRSESCGHAATLRRGAELVKARLRRDKRQKERVHQRGRLDGRALKHEVRRVERVAPHLGPQPL